MTSRSRLLASLASRYIWWRDPAPPSDDRTIAQVMNLGTYEDIRRLEHAFGPEELRAVMLRAQPGWIARKSWNFWRARLRRAGEDPIPQAPPRRAFHAEVSGAVTLQDEIDTLAVSVALPQGAVKLSFLAASASAA
jgi:hypothetical protein